MGEYRSGIAAIRHGLGQVMCQQRRWDAAVAEYREAIVDSEQAIRLDPSNLQFRRFLGNHRFNLGLTHQAMGRTAEAEADFRQAAAIDEDLARTGPAVADFRNNLVAVRVHLGALLMNTGRPGEAAAELRKAAAINPQDRTARSTLAEAERLVAVEDAFSALIAGGVAPSPDEAKLDVAFVCLGRERYRTAARLYADAFASRPEQAGDPEARHRYRAACAAAMGSIGKGGDRPPTDPSARADLRRQALDWLRADLAAWRRVAMTVEPGNKQRVLTTLQGWQIEPQLASLRNEAALASLPEPELADFRKLWADVDRLLARVEGRP